jgi:hypothetical protein
MLYRRDLNVILYETPAFAQLITRNFEQNGNKVRKWRSYEMIARARTHGAGTLPQENPP